MYKLFKKILLWLFLCREVSCLTTDIISIKTKSTYVENQSAVSGDTNTPKEILGSRNKLFGKSKTFACDLCTYSTHSKSNLNKHTLRHSQKFKVKCNVCNKGFYSMTRYREHTLDDGMCQDSCFLKCSECNKRCRSITKLAQHVKSHIPGYSPPGFQCDSCGKMFLTKRGLGKHQSVVHQGVRFTCSFCSKQLTSSHSLAAHMRAHTSERTQLMCGVCGKTYGTFKYLAAHEMTHTGESPFSCDICHQVFTQKATLVVHKRYHTGERPFKCARCDKAFVTKSILKSHEKIHKA